jgi:hypothetical protein
VRWPFGRRVAVATRTVRETDAWRAEALRLPTALDGSRPSTGRTPRMVFADPASVLAQAGAHVEKPTTATTTATPRPTFTRA